MLLISNDGVRILNGSWYNWCIDNPSFDPFLGQGVYNEIYENGTIACFGAGNGYNHCKFKEVYPAAYDHNISVSSVGCEKNYGEKSWWPGLPDSIYWGMKDVHWDVVGDIDTTQGVIHMASIHNHNSKVDICAPGYTVRVTTESGGYASNGWGTSFASPIVAGTCGLMLSANNCLTPYQLEFGLKTMAHNIYDIPENLQFIGMLGAGRLDAGASVSWAANHDCNSLFTSTMHIKGIELNTICIPGGTVNSVNPTLSPIILNGNPPYKYKWEAIPGNTTTLDDYGIENPEIITSTSTNRAYYRLTVYDNSQIEKVASKIIDITLRDTQTYDLVVRDSYMDMYNEPNNQIILNSREWDIFQSPDVWNRKTQDGIATHEHPEYFTSLPNHIYSRIRNVGCTANPTGKKLHLYWTKASTGEDWDDDWTIATIIGSSGQPVAAGGEITTTPISIPVIQPGSEWITNLPWYPIEPEAYDSTINSVDVCFLSRITESDFSPFGMTFSEVEQVKTNIINNNNIATRNFIVTNFLPGNSRKRHQILVANIENVSRTFNFEILDDRLINPHISGDISAFGEVVLHLGDLFDRWASNGKKGSVMKADTINKTVTFSGERLVLEGIELIANEKIPIIIEFAGYGYSEIPHEVYFRQISPIFPASDQVYGSVTFFIEPLVEIDSLENRSVNQDVKFNNFTLRPNPASDFIEIIYTGEDVDACNLVIHNSLGMHMETMKIDLKPGSIVNFDTQEYPVGIYFVSIRTASSQSSLSFIKQ